MHGHDLSGDDATTNGRLGHGGLNWFYEMISIRHRSVPGPDVFRAHWQDNAGLDPRRGGVGLGQLAGAAALYIVYWLLKQVYRLQHAGNEDVRKAIGLPATVYVPIAGKRARAGKVTFRLQNRLVEYPAITDDDERLRHG